MYRMRELFYKLLFKIFVRDKLKRKFLTRCLSKVGIIKYFQLRRLVKEEAFKEPKFKYNIAMTCIAKNEGDYFREWIEYHKLIGVEHFYVYNNNTEDNTKEILQEYINKGLVTWIDWPEVSKNAQDNAYRDAVAKFKNETRWMAVIDLDEFMVLKKHKSLSEFMKDYKDYAQISLQWVTYGSSGHKKKPEGLVLENFKAHAKEPEITPKSIFNPRVTVDCGAHWMYVCGPWVDEDKKDYFGSEKNKVNIAQVNHYVIKSEEEFYHRKAPKGCVDADQQKFKDLAKFFADSDKNDVVDDLMIRYVEKLKKVL